MACEKTNVGLELLICYYKPVYLDVTANNAAFADESRKWAISQQRKKLEEIAAPLRERGLDVVVSAIWDRVLADGIVHHVLRTNARMVIKDTHYHGAINRAIFTNTDWQLIRNCPVPLWLTKDHEWTEVPTILASVDPTHEHDEYAELDVEILKETERLRSDFGGETHVFHAHQTMGALDTAFDYVNTDGVDEAIRKDHENRVNGLLGDFEVSSDNVHIMAGDPADLLPELASELDASVVVMGAIARNPLKRLFIGSTSEEVMDKLPCDLMIVKPAWFTSSLAASTPAYYDGTRDKLPALPGGAPGEAAALLH